MISDETPTPHPGAALAPARVSAGYVGRVLTALAIVVLVALTVYLRAVVVLVFGSIIVAVAVRSGSEALQRATGWRDRVALSVVLLGTLGVLTLGVLLLGEPIGEQFVELRRALPAAYAAITRWLNSHDVGLWLLRWWDEANTSVEWTRIAGVAGSAIGALGSALLMIVTGLYLAADPNLYRRGVLHLLPQAQRPRVDRALREAGNGLSRWLMGQAVAMVLVGAMTAAGLALIGVPLALPLGIIAGVLEFIPFFGTFVAGALIVLFAFTQGAAQAAYAALVCFLVQNVEGYLIQPFVQRWAIALPPALGLIAVIVFGLLFGALGVVFAVPLMVVLMIVVRHLYVDGVLGERTASAPRGNLDCQLHPEAGVAHRANPPDTSVETSR